ncbi:hypothetical protein ACTAZI_09600 [Legionella bozemanae]|uniref:hypothetical protein n=1 Tax=Legionella bozemanae TaxID=447 RepID=UPI003EEFAA76
MSSISFFEAQLRSFYKKREQRENADITIRDLVIYPQSSFFSQGEAGLNTNPYSFLDMYSRLAEHVEFLFDLVNNYHRQAYCIEKDGKFYLQEQYKNTITRLSLYEFALYGKEYITIDKFNLLIEKIEHLATNSLDNVHVCLSSFPILDSNGKILNCTLYVTCGTNFQIRAIFKSTASSVDVTYPGLTNFSQTNYPASEVSSYIVGSNQELISNNSIFEIETVGGAKYVQVIDICLDHKFKHAKNLFMQQLEPNFPTDTSHFLIPIQVDQLVISNSIQLIDDAKICPSILHVDPAPVFYDKENKDRPVEQKFVFNPKDLPKWAKKYSLLNITPNPCGLQVFNPPFGSDFDLVAYQERTLTTYLPEIAKQVQIINQRILDEKLKKLIGVREGYSSEELTQAPMPPVDLSPLVLDTDLLFLENEMLSSSQLVIDEQELEKMMEFFDNTTPPVLVDDLALPEGLLLLPLEQFCIPQAEELEPVATLPPRLQQEFQSAKQPSFFNMRVMKRKHGDDEISDELESPKRRQFGHG